MLIYRARPPRCNTQPRLAGTVAGHKAPTATREQAGARPSQAKPGPPTWQWRLLAHFLTRTSNFSCSRLRAMVESSHTPFALLFYLLKKGANQRKQEAEINSENEIEYEVICEAVGHVGHVVIGGVHGGEKVASVSVFRFYSPLQAIFFGSCVFFSLLFSGGFLPFDRFHLPARPSPVHPFYSLPSVAHCSVL